MHGQGLAQDLVHPADEKSIYGESDTIFLAFYIIFCLKLTKWGNYVIITPKTSPFWSCVAPRSSLASQGGPRSRTRPEWLGRRCDNMTLWCFFSWNTSWEHLSFIWLEFSVQAWFFFLRYFLSPRRPRTLRNCHIKSQLQDPLSDVHNDFFFSRYNMWIYSVSIKISKTNENSCLNTIYHNTA